MRNFVKSISGKRTVLARTDFDIYLDQHLENSIDTADRNSVFLDIAKTIEARVRSTTRGAHTYDKWIDEQSMVESSNYEKAVRWRMLEIRIVRNMADAQRKILDTPLDPEPVDRNSDLETAAIFFLHSEFNAPYYFGFHNVSKMATFNVEVFLKIAAALFEEIVSQRIKNKNTRCLLQNAGEDRYEHAKKHFKQIRKTSKNGKTSSNSSLHFSGLQGSKPVDQALRTFMALPESESGRSCMNSYWTRKVEESRNMSG